MRRSEAFPSRYMGKDDIVPGRILTIHSVVPEGVESDGDVKQKVVMYFIENDAKPWIVNAGNWMTIEDAYGEESDHWSGKTIELFVDPTVMFGGKRVGGVRVRIPTASQPAGQKQRNHPQPQLSTETITGVEVKGGWYGIQTDKGLFVTNNKDLGDTVQSWGHIPAAFTYEINPQGKRLLLDASPAGDPATVPADDDNDVIPF